MHILFSENKINKGGKGSKNNCIVLITTITIDVTNSLIEHYVLDRTGQFCTRLVSDDKKFFQAL